MAEPDPQLSHALQERRRAWSATAAAPAGWIIIALAIAIPAVFILGAMFGLPGAYVSSMPHDSLSMADLGYRLASGQVPGRDFHSAFGVIFLEQMDAAYRLGKTVPGTLEYASLLFMAAEAAVFAYLARTRLSNLGALGVGIGVLLLSCAPYARFDEFLGGVSYAMMYNREGWGLLTLLFLFWLEPRRPTAVWSDGLVIGLLVAAGIYIKISYGGVGLLFCGLCFLFRPTLRLPLLLGAVAAVVIAGAIELRYGIGFNAAYLAEIVTVAHAGGSRLGQMGQALSQSRFELAVACVFAPLAVASFAAVKPRDLMFVLFTSACSLLIVWQNAQADGLTLLLAAVAAMIEPVLRAGEARPTADLRVLSGGVLYLAWIVLNGSPSAIAILQYAHGSLKGPTPAKALPEIAGLHIQIISPANKLQGLGVVYGDDYLASLVNGAALLRACPPRGRVFTVDLFDPFAIVTQRPPNEGWSWHHLNHSFSIASHPDAAVEFRDVSCVMTPKKPNSAMSTMGLQSIYGNYIRARFPYVIDTPDWTLSMRAPAAPPS